MSTPGVIKSVDIRAFPVEIAKKLLSLGNALDMGSGPAAYFEAEKSLVAYLDVLTTYAKIMWQSGMDFRMQQRSVERFVQMHKWNHNLMDNQARDLLDHMHFFPEVKDDSVSGESTN